MLSLEYLLFAGGTLGLLLTYFLFNKKVNILANRMLAVTILAYSLDILYAFYVVTGLYITYPQLIGFSGPLPFIYSPALYLYTRLVSENKKTFNLNYLFHFLPVALLTAAGIIGVFIFSEESRMLLMNPDAEKNPLIVAMRVIIPFYGITYIILSILEIIKYNHRIKENFSDIEKLKLDWLIYLIFGITLVWLLEFIQVILIDIAGKPENIAYSYIYATVSIIIYMITYKSLKQPGVFSEVELKEKDFDDKLSSSEEETTLYKKSGLTEEKAGQILSNLLKIMNDDKPYLKSNLSLSDLSTILGVSTHNLSEVINLQLNKSFYDFVNHYRVEEVKKMLKDKNYESYSILAIAFEAGFNSKSAFNSIFKKVAGDTPTAFRRAKKN